MRKLLLAGAASAALVASPAHADVPVIDGSNLIAQAKNLLQELKSWGTQLQQLQTELEQVQWAVSLTTNLVHNPSLGTVLPLLQQLGLSPDLPINPYAVQSLISGYGGINGLSGILGKASTLGSLVNGTYSADNLNPCTDNSFACVQSNATMAGLAGTKGIAAQIMSDVQAHTVALQAIRARLLGATNPKDVADLQAQLETENTWTTNEATQLQAVQVMAAAQQQVNTQQADEKINSDIAAFIAAAPKD